MTPRSQRHHQVPIWLLKHFSWKRRKSRIVWVGFKDSRDVKPVPVKDALFRNNANTRTDYQTQADGNLHPVKSDKDERILADFDNKAAPAARRLISLAKKWRDEGEVYLQLSPDDFEIWKQTVVVQARRTRESQDRAGLDQDKSGLYLDLFSKRAEEQGQQLPTREDLLRDPRVRNLFDILSQNHRANFASANHPILADKEREFLAQVGLSVAVIKDPNLEFIIGSHGVTVVENADGKTAWLPVAPDVAVSLSDRPGTMAMGICTDEFVEKHSHAALALSAQIAGRSKEVIQELLGTLD